MCYHFSKSTDLVNNGISEVHLSLQPWYCNWSLIGISLYSEWCSFPNREALVDDAVDERRASRRRGKEKMTRRGKKNLASRKTCSPRVYLDTVDQLKRFLSSGASQRDPEQAVSTLMATIFGHEMIWMNGASTYTPLSKANRQSF